MQRLSECWWCRWLVGGQQWPHEPVDFGVEDGHPLPVGAVRPWPTDLAAGGFSERAGVRCPFGGERARHCQLEVVWTLR